MTLPIEAALPELLARLDACPNAVLIAPPGAGKTTRVPLALLDAGWRHGGRIIVLEPRRLAARAAAGRMAATLGEDVGATVGYRVRLDSRVSKATRIEVVTEGVFTRMIADDPSLDGIAAVLFDEFHERSLDGDLGLALALDAQGALRPDLRLLVMSATLDGARVAAILGEASQVVSEGRAFPVETRYLGRDTGLRIEAACAAAVRRALAEDAGSILAFLPGQGEIRRLVELLAPQVGVDVDIAPLYGALPPQEQDRAIRPAAPGRRKIVVATSVAETSLTIEGVRIVVDCGLSRVPVYEPATGLTRLETVRVSRASADQRRGRAGRTGPGICYRLWHEPETASLKPFNAPEIIEADLSSLVLDLAAWGVSDPAQLAFLDPPPKPAWGEAVELLTELDALDGDGRLTSTGRALGRLPLHPRLAHMILKAGEEDAAPTAAEIAAIVGERGLGGTAVDLADRLSRFRADRSPRGAEARQMAARWSATAGGSRRRDPSDGPSPGRLLALAYPDRIAQARGAPGAFRLANGRGAMIEAHEPLARAAFIVVADLQGAAQNARVSLAAGIELADIEAEFAAHIVEETEVRFDAASGGVRARRIRRLNKLVLAERVVERPDPDKVAAALVAGVRQKGLASLPFSKAAKQLRARAAFARRADPDWPDLSDEALLAGLESWLQPHIDGKRSLGEIGADDLGGALETLIDWERKARLDRLAPTHFTAPSGSNVPIDYEAENGPVLSIRVQELFGLDTHPAIAEGRVALLVELLSPAHRPIQVTRDLPGFWRGSWRDVKLEMKGRYPKHVWPDDPLSATATSRAKPRGT
ncbi:MAG: ATP-dependent helicase HrpB [Ancalomicrobiaceae bacterium]|nr:ATP-dependent helicase HrpB [Ancalomicrobiaceae bacterium]